MVAISQGIDVASTSFLEGSAVMVVEIRVLVCGRIVLLVARSTVWLASRFRQHYRDHGF